MGCMEHFCLECDWCAFDNTRGPRACPRCGGAVRHRFDEPDEPNYNDRDDSPPEQEGS